MISDLNVILINSGLVEERVYPCVLPEPIYPAIAHTLVGTTTDQRQSGSCETAVARVQIDIIGDDYTEIDGIAESVRTLLRATTGEHGATNFVACRADNELDNPQPYNDGTGKWVFIRTQDWLIKFAPVHIDNSSQQ